MGSVLGPAPSSTLRTDDGTNEAPELHPDDKKATRERYERIAKKHHRSHEEEKKRRARAKERKAGLQPQSRRPRAARDEDELEEELFEKIRRAPRDEPQSGAQAVLPPNPLELPAHARLARVTTVHRARLQARCEAGDRAECDLAPPRANVSSGPLVVGDLVWIDTTPQVNAILAVEPRRTFLTRPDGADEHREHAMVANVDVGVVVAAVREPGVRPGLIQRLHVALSAREIDTLVVLNKSDLLAAAEREQLRRDWLTWGLESLPVREVSAAERTGLDELRAYLSGKTCVFLGHSGVGKSSLLNALRPGTQQPTAAGRAYDGKGRHTTTGSSLWELEPGTCVIDTPGVRSFALRGLDPAAVSAAFPEIAALAPDCRFADCRHAEEPGCAVTRAVDEGALPAEHLARFRKLLE